MAGLCRGQGPRDCRIAPKDKSRNGAGDRQAYAELGCDIESIACRRSHAIKDCLDEEVMAGVQHGAWPEAVGSQAKPCELEGAADDHQCEAGEGEEFWSARVVVGHEQQRVVPDSPDASADKAAKTQAECICKPRKQEAAPANLFTERSCDATHYANCSENWQAEQEGGDARPGGEVIGGCGTRREVGES